MQKQKMNTDTLAGNLAVPSLEYDGYASFFSGLLEVTHTRAVDDGLGERIEEYVMSWLGDHALDGFDDYSADGYRRTYLGRSPEMGWEAIVMSWQEGNRTSIHAHPQFAGYFFADGRFLVEIFAPAAAGYARLQRSVVVEAPLGFYAVGAEGSFENHIHRITCLSPTGHSLHVYSDDALRGTVYRETMQ